MSAAMERREERQQLLGNVQDQDTSWLRSGAINADKPAGEVRGDGAASQPATIINLMANTIGAGVLTLPYSLSKTGFGAGPALLLLVCIASNFTLKLLVECSNITGTYTYKEVAVKALGPRAAIFVQFFSIAYTLGSLTGYCVLIGDFIPDVMHDLFPGVPLLYNRAFVMGMVGLFVLLPLSSFKSLTPLRYTSFASLFFAVYMTIAVAIRYFKPDAQAASIIADTHPVAFNEDIEFLIAIPLMAVSFTVHYNLLRLYKELYDNTKERMAASLNTASVTTLAIYLVVAEFAYLSFGPNTPSDVLDAYLDSDLLILIARVGLALSITFVFPLVALSTKSNLRLALCPGAPETLLRSVLMAAALVVCCGTLAYVEPDITVVLAFNGSVNGIMIVFILPSLFYIRLAAIEGDKGGDNSLRLLASRVVFCAGILGSIGGVSVTAWRLITHRT